MNDISEENSSLTLSNVPEGMDALVIAESVKGNNDNIPLLHIARDDQRMENMAELVSFYIPEAEVIDPVSLAAPATTNEAIQGTKKSLIPKVVWIAS